MININISQSFNIDDDTIILPKWMIKELKITEGEPICLTLDKNLINLQKIVFQQSPSFIYL
jgi:hypothetical protein